MRSFKHKADSAQANLERLIDQYAEYRQMQYDIFKQYNLLLEDPKFDEIYMDITPLVNYRKYMENDLNGAPDRDSTTAIIKEFKKLLETYKQTSANFQNEAQA